MHPCRTCWKSAICGTGGSSSQGAAAPQNSLQSLSTGGQGKLLATVHCWLPRAVGYKWWRTPPRCRSPWAGPGPEESPCAPPVRHWSRLNLKERVVKSAPQPRRGLPPGVSCQLPLPAKLSTAAAGKGEISNGLTYRRGNWRNTQAVTYVFRDSTSICNLLSTSGVPYNDKTVPYVHLMNYSYLSYK